MDFFYVEKKYQPVVRHIKSNIARIVLAGYIKNGIRHDTICHVSISICPTGNVFENANVFFHLHSSYEYISRCVYVVQTTYA